MTHGLIFCLSLCCLLSSSLKAEELSLLTAYDKARSSAPMLAIANFRVDGAEAQKDVAASRLRPQISLFGQWSENDLRYNDDLYPNDEYRGERLGVQVRQPLVNLRDLFEKQRLETAFSLSKKELVIEEGRLLNAVVTAYMDIILADSTLTYLQSELAALTKQLDESRALYERRLTPVTAVRETESRLDSLQVDIITAKGEAAIAREQLTKLLGLRDFSLQAIKDHFVLLNGLSDIEAAAHAAISNSPKVLAAEVAVSVSEKAVSREQGAFAPQIDFTYSFQHSDVGFDNLSIPARDTSTVAIGFNYPIFEGGGGSARLRGAKSELYVAQARLEEERRESEALARSAWLHLEASQDRVIASRRAVDTAQVNVNAAERAAKAGVGRTSQVLIALAQSTKSKRDETLARLAYAIAWLDLQLATGVAPQQLAEELSVAIHRR